MRAERLPPQWPETVLAMLRMRRSVRARPPAPRRAVRTRGWLLAVPVGVLLIALLALQAIGVRQSVADRERYVRAIGAAPPGPEDASPLRTAALQRFTLRQRYLRYPSGGPGETLAWSPDGTYVATGSGDGTIALWHAADGRLRWAIDPLRRPVGSLAWSADGRHLAAGAPGGAVLVLDTRDARVERRLPAARYVTPAVAYSPDGRRLAVASGRGEVTIWDSRQGGTASRLPSAPALLRRVALGRATTALGWSPDSRLLAVGELDGTVVLWDMGTGHLRARMPSAHGGSLWSLQWSPTGTRLALGWADGTVRILAGPGLVAVRTLQAAAAVNTLSWSAEGTLLAVTAVGRPISIWEARTGALVGQIRTGWDTNQVAWSPDGRSLATVTDGREMRVWQVTPPTGDLSWLICKLQPGACSGLGGQAGSMASYMGR